MQIYFIDHWLFSKRFKFNLFCRYAQYSHFKIYSEADYYKLEIDGYEGNAGDSLNDPWYGSNNSPFSTYNRDNDRSSLNCASMLKVSNETFIDIGLVFTLANDSIE